MPAALTGWQRVQGETDSREEAAGRDAGGRLDAKSHAHGGGHPRSDEPATARSVTFHSFHLVSLLLLDDCPRRPLPRLRPPTPCPITGPRLPTPPTILARVHQRQRTMPSLAPLAPPPSSPLFSHRRQESRRSPGMARTPRDNHHWAMASSPPPSTPTHLSASAHDQHREEAHISIASHPKSPRLSPHSSAL